MKENHELGQGIFLPRDILDLKVNLSKKVLLGFVWWMQKNKAGCFASNEWLGRQIGLTAVRVKQMLADLEAAGLLKKWFGPDGKRRLFVLINQATEGIEINTPDNKKSVGVSKTIRGGIENYPQGVSKTTHYKIEYEIDDEINTCRATARHEKYSVDTYKAIEDAFGESYKQRTGKEYKNTNIPAGRKALKNLLQSGADPDTIADMARAYVEQADGKYRPYTLLAFVKHYNDIQASAPKSMKQVAKELSRHKPLEMREEKLIFLEDDRDEMF